MQKNSVTAFTPESILADGVDNLISTNPYTGESGPARKGTVAATLNNIALLNELMLTENSFEGQSGINTILQNIVLLIPSLRVIGVFNLFSPDEWLLDNNQPGRILTVVLYLQNYPIEISTSIKQRLIQIKKHTPLNIISQAIDDTLGIQ